MRRMPEERPAPEPPDAAMAEPGSGETPADFEKRILELQEQIRQKTAELQAKHDQYLRAAADYDNYRKRVQREKSDAIRLANESLLRDVLPVLDSLELALEHADLGGNGKSVIEGVELTLRLFRDVLERYGVKTVTAPEGTAFDPAVHEASGVEATTHHPPNAVIRQDQKGYMLHDRLLRPARVVVSTDGSSGSAGPESQGSVH
jgi:molecular chaperone GrpE